MNTWIEENMVVIEDDEGECVYIDIDAVPTLIGALNTIYGDSD